MTCHKDDLGLIGQDVKIIISTERQFIVFRSFFSSHWMTANSVHKLQAWLIFQGSHSPSREKRGSAATRMFDLGGYTKLFSATDCALRSRAVEHTDANKCVVASVRTTRVDGLCSRTGSGLVTRRARYKSKWSSGQRPRDGSGSSLRSV